MAFWACSKRSSSDRAAGSVRAETAPAEVEALISEAGDLYEQAQDALAAGDFAEYGRLIERLGEVLAELTELSGGGGGQ